MRKNKLLLLLALLLTAATGAWATDVYVVGNGTGNWLNGVIWDPGAPDNKMTEQNGVYSITFTNVDANPESSFQFKFAINGTWDVTYGCTSDTENELNKTLSNIDATGGMYILFGLTEKADVTISFNLSEMTYMISTKGMKVGDDAATGPKHLITAKYHEQTRSLEQPLPYATTIGELFEAVTGEHFSDLISTMSSMEMPLTGISSNNTSAVSIGELNGASTPVTVIADGEATVAINFSGYPLGILVSAISPLYVSLKDGVKDADKWTVKVGDGQAQALPIGGLKGNGSETVTLQYNGRLKVKGVKATSEAAATDEPEVTYTLLSAATTADCGKVVCAAGHLHDAKTAVPDGCTAVGILGKVTETGHGLILALKDATSQNWNTINGWTSASYAGTTLKVLTDDARGTNLTSYAKLGDTTVSNWAVAQKSDYEAIFTNLGTTTGDSDGMTYDGNVNAYITTGVGGTAISVSCWSATGYDDNFAWYFNSSFWNYNANKEDSFKIRPVLGF